MFVQAAPTEPEQSTQFRWFLAGQGFWFSAFGLQAVMFPYLVVSVLQASPDAVGVAQMCLMAPSLLLMLPGGVLADALDLRTLLWRLQALAVLPALTMMFITGADKLTYAAVIGFAIAQGSLQALIMPARDALLGRVAGNQVQRAVTTAMLLQFVTQLGGFILAGSAGILGVPVVLGLQAGLYACGAACAAVMRPVPPLTRDGSGDDDELDDKAPDRKATTGGWRQFTEVGTAFREVFHSPRMGPVTVLMVGVGIFFIGMFTVVIPVMVRDVYGGESMALALVNGAFVAGVLTSTSALRMRAPLARQGRAVFLSGCGGATMCMLFSLHPPVAIFYLMIYVFGGGAGVAMSIGRTLVQEAAAPAHRARILAVYSVAFLGAAPLGSFLMGQIAERVSLSAAALSAGIGMATLLVVLAFVTPIWTVTRPEAEAG